MWDGDFTKFPNLSPQKIEKICNLTSVWYKFSIIRVAFAYDIAVIRGIQARKLFSKLLADAKAKAHKLNEESLQKLKNKEDTKELPKEENTQLPIVSSQSVES